MQRAFIFILFLWNPPASASGDTTDLLNFSLGCTAVIPCQRNTGHSKRVKWLYKTDTRDEEKTILLIDKGGIQSHNNHVFRHKVRVGPNGFLIIDSFTEDYEGLYWCEYCDQSDCGTEKHRFFRVKKEILNETLKTVYVTEGSTFEHTCPGEVTSTRWTFEARNTSSIKTLKQGPDVVTLNKSIHIVNVKTTDAGRYTCWMSRCNGHTVKLLTITLCVAEHCTDLSVCDKRLSNAKPNSMSSEQSINLTSDTSNKTPAPREYQMTITYGTLGALVCLVFIALLSCYLRSKLQSACSCCPSCLDCTVEEGVSLVYSSIIIRRPAEITNNHMPKNECVYTEIKV